MCSVNCIHEIAAGAAAGGALGRGAGIGAASLPQDEAKKLPLKTTPHAIIKKIFRMDLWNALNMPGMLLTAQAALVQAQSNWAQSLTHLKLQEKTLQFATVTLLVKD